MSNRVDVFGGTMLAASTNVLLQAQPRHNIVLEQTGVPNVAPYHDRTVMAGLVHDRPFTRTGHRCGGRQSRTQAVSGEICSVKPDPFDMPLHDLGYSVGR